MSGRKWDEDMMEKCHGKVKKQVTGTTKGVVV